MTETPTPTPALASPQHPVAPDAYDAGLLSDHGGGNVEWWWDYIRSELARAHEFYTSQWPSVDATDFLQRLRAANVRRDAEYRAKTSGEPLPVLFRTTEFAGEVGELLNVVKKMERERLGWSGKRATREMLLEEFGGVVATLDLLAMSLGVDLAEATAAEFNAVTDRLSLSTRLTSHLPAQDAPGAVAAWSFEILQHDDSWRADLSFTKPVAPYGGAIRNVRPLAALDPSPPLPKADGEVVAWFCETPFGRSITQSKSDVETWTACENVMEPLVRQSALLAEEEVSHVRLVRINAERAAREKAEQVAAGYHEFVEDIATTAFIDTVNYRAKLREFANRAMELLRVSTEGKTATQSVTEEEADQNTPPEGYTVEYGSHRSWHAFHRSRRISAWGCKADAIKACWDHVALTSEPKP